MPNNTPPPAPAPPMLSYIIALCFMALVGVAAILGILLLRPKEDNALLIGQILGMLTPTTAIIIAIIHNASVTEKQHLAMNSRLDELVAAKEEAARAQGVEAGRLAVEMPIPVQVQLVPPPAPPAEPVPVVVAPKEEGNA